MKNVSQGFDQASDLHREKRAISDCMKVKGQATVRRGPKPDKLTARLKKCLAESPIPYLPMLDAVNRLSLLNKWRQEHLNIPYFPQREELYKYLIDLIGGQEIVYLEFGVWRGNSMRYWLQSHRNPRSRFFGFDTFEGLPEDWATEVESFKKGHFSTNGMIPNIDDSRVRFLKGLFQETLPAFLESVSLGGAQLVINNDSDLHSSTLFTLCSLHSVMGRGTIVIFDEFSHVLDEFRALQDYVGAFRRNYDVIAASGQYYDRVAIRFI